MPPSGPETLLNGLEKKAAMGVEAPRKRLGRTEHRPALLKGASSQNAVGRPT
jgi:hypothetical protein